MDLPESPLRVLWPLSWSELMNAAHVKALLAKVVEGSFFGETLTNIIEDVERGSSIVWWIEPGALLITSLRERHQGKELYVHSLVGAGVLDKKVEIAQDLETLAKEFKCRWISALTVRTGIEQLVKAPGQYSALYSVREIDHG